MFEQAVDVIALCTASGELSPLRLRLEDREQGTLRFVIDRVISKSRIDCIGAEGTMFRCRATMGGRQWTVELRYCRRSQMWLLTRLSAGTDCNFGAAVLC